jgi:hypothetical protein
MKLKTQIKKLLKKNNLYKDYKLAFPHRQTRLITTFLANLIYSSNEVKTIYEMEVSLITAKKDRTLFNKVFTNLKKMGNQKYLSCN